MSEPRKICVVVTARTSYTKIKPILSAVQNHPDLHLDVICAASAVLERYGDTDKMVERDGFPVSERIHNILEGETLLTSAKSTGFGIIEFASAFARLQPDCVLVMADRFEILSAAIAASYQNIPLAHVQGGEVSGNIDEKVRHAVTKMADIHFPASELAAEYIVRMGEDPASVHHVGCPSMDIVQDILKSPAMDFDLYERYGGVGSFPDLSQGYYIVMQHSVTTEYEQARAQAQETLKAMDRIAEPVIWFWPNIDAGADHVSKAIRSYRENQKPEHMHFIKNMAPADFLRFLHASKGIVGNSSTGIREASFMGIPCVNIGSRQNGRQRGPNVMDTGYDENQIYEAVKAHCKGKTEASTLYGSGDAGKRIADILAECPLNFSKTLSYAAGS